MKSEERRVHGRIETHFQCKVTAGGRAHLARIRQLSVDGASLLAPNGMAKIGDTITIEMEELGKGHPLRARVVRMEGEGLKLRYGVRLMLEGQEQKNQINELMQSLVGAKGSSSREHPRVYRYVSIQFRGEEQLEGLMSNISRGGLGFESDTPAKMGEQVMVEIRLEDSTRLEVPCVVSSVRMASGRPGEIGKFQIGLRFEDLTADQQGAVDKLMHRLLGHGG
jgi:hypothetical protein